MNDLYICCKMYEKKKKVNAIVLRDKQCLEAILSSIDFLNSLSDPQDHILIEPERDLEESQANFKSIILVMNKLIALDNIELREL